MLEPTPKALVVLLGLALWLPTGPTLAQDDDSDAAQDGAGETITEVITVTARQAEEALQDVPGTVSVLTDSQIEAVGVRRAEDFIKLVPKFPAWLPRIGGMEIWRWVFNVADAALVCGVGVLLMNTWFDRKDAAAPSNE